jgi:hypothetical protein
LRNRLTFTRRFTCTMSSMPSRLRSTTAAPRPLTKLAMPAASPLDERPVGPSDQQVARVPRGEVLLGLDVALGDEQIDDPVVVDVLELGMPCRRGQGIAARVGTRRGHALVDRDVPVGRPAGRVRQRLELVVSLACQIHLGQAVTGDVVAGDAHPQITGAASRPRGVEARRLARRRAELLLAVEVVVATFAIRIRGPLRSQSLNRTERSRVDRSRVRRSTRRPHELVVGAVRPLLVARSR